MGKVIVDEEMRFNVIINGAAAQKQLYELEKRNKSLTLANKDLNAERTKLVAQGKKNSQEYKNLTAEITKNNAELKLNKAQMAKLQQQLGVTALTMRQLQQRASHLRLQLLNMVPGSPNRKKLEAELRLINTQIQKLGLNARAAQSGLSKVANGFNKYAALGAAAIATATGFVLSLQKMVDLNGKLSDAQSDVQKTTGLTKKEVDELTKSFGLLQTRTARIDLLKIAEEGGRIGILKEDIGDFVEVMNKAAVALGDSFPGGAEEVASKLGKLKFLFQETKDLNVDLAFNAIGSSLNELGASGNATEINIAEFASRIGALPDGLKPSIAETLALGAAFEESGIQSEIAARAYGIFLQQASTNTDKFAKVMGISEKQVKDLINTNPLEFFLQFSEGLKGLDATQIGDTLEYLGVSATGATKALGAAANNQERFRELITISNTALVDATSLTNEYDIKNNNLAATLDKVKKQVLATFTSESVVKGLSSFVDWFAKFIGASEDADGKVTRFRNVLVALLKSLLVVTVAIISYRTAVQLAALWTGTLDATSKLYIVTQKIQTLTTTVLRTGSLLLSAAFALMTGNLVRARAAMVLLNRTMMLSPIGFIVGAIAAIAAAYLIFSDNSKKAATAQSQMNDAIKEANIQTAAETNHLKELLKVARDKTKSDEARQKAIDELNRTVPEYNNNLTIESANTLDATNKLNAYIEKIKEAAREKYFKALVDQKAEELIKAESSSLEDNVNWWDKTVSMVKAVGNQGLYAVNLVDRALDNQTETVKRLNQELELANQNYQKAKETNSGNVPPPVLPKEGEEKTINGRTFVFKNGQWVVKNPFKPTTGGGDSGTDKAADERRKEAAELLKIQRETEDQRIALIQDSFQREMAQNAVNHARKIEDLKIKAADALAAYDEANKPGGDTDLAAIFKKQYDETLNQIEVLEETHQQNINKTLEKGIQDHIKKLQEKAEREEQERLIAHNNELAALGTNEEAKKALQDQFDKEKLERQKANQQVLIGELKKILDTAKFEDFSLELLTAEQLQTLKDRLADLGLSLSEINRLLAFMKKGGDQDAITELGGIGIDANSGVDILGMNDEQWSKIFERTETLAGAIGKIGQVVGAAAQAYAMYDQFVTASENKKLQKLDQNLSKEKDKQKRLLDNKFITQKQYDTNIKALEDENNKRKAEIEHKQAKRQKMINIATILSNTAVAVSKALAQGGFVLGVPWAAVVAALGAIQLGFAIAQPLPSKGFEQGFYDNMRVRREQDGKLFNAAYGGPSRSGAVDKPTVFLAGEGGKNFPEMIINGKDLKRFDPDLKNSLYRELGRIRGFEGGYYPKQEELKQEPATQSLYPEFIAALNRNSEVLEKIEKDGMIAYLDKSMRNLQKLRDEMDRLKRIENKSKL